MTNFCWMIEAPGPRYLTTNADRREFFWTSDPQIGLRFFSSEQADALMMAVRQMDLSIFGFEETLGNAKPVEHGFG